MVNWSHNAPTNIQPISPLTSFGTLSTLVSTSQPEFVTTPFLDMVRNIIERDTTVSPVSPKEMNQTLEESWRILTRAYSHQIGIPPINFGLPSRVHFQTLAVTKSAVDSIGEEPLEPLRVYLDYHLSILLRGIADPNTSRWLLSAGGSDQTLSPPKSPPDSPMIITMSLHQIQNLIKTWVIVTKVTLMVIDHGYDVVLFL